jgi:hypothetical protein
MISREGKVYSVEAHPYMDYDFVQMNLVSGLWFYNHTVNSDVKQAYIDLIAYYAKNEYGSVVTISSLEIPEIEKIKNFIQEHYTEIEKSIEKGNSSKKEILDVLVKESNQEFLRVRYGGTYKTVAGVREIYFRVSSIGFNWYNIIWEYVYTNKALIDYVTIVRDVASTGSSEYYKGKNGEYNNMPVDAFLTETGNPVIEWKYKLPTVRRHLALGGTIKDIENLPMNPDRAKEEFACLLEAENNRPRFYYDMDYVINEILDGQPINQVILEYFDY